MGLKCKLRIYEELQSFRITVFEIGNLELELQIFKDLSIFLITKFERWISDLDYKFMKIIQAFKLHNVWKVDLEFEIQVFEVSESKRPIDRSWYWITYFRIKSLESRIVMYYWWCTIVYHTEFEDQQQFLVITKVVKGR